MEEQKVNESAEKEVKPVAKGHLAEPKKKGVGDKLWGFLVQAEDDDISGYIRKEIIWPTIRNGLADILGDAIDYTLRGRIGGRTRRSDGSYGGRRDYGSYSNTRGSERLSEAPRRAHSSYGGTEDVWFEDRSQAMDLRDRLVDILEKNGSVAVYEFYENADLRAPNGSTDWNYGWYDLRDMSVENDHGRWVLLMPKVVQLAKGDRR